MKQGNISNKPKEIIVPAEVTEEFINIAEDAINAHTWVPKVVRESILYTIIDFMKFGSTVMIKDEKYGALHGKVAPKKFNNKNNNCGGKKNYEG